MDGGRSRLPSVPRPPLDGSGVAWEGQAWLTELAAPAAGGGAKAAPPHKHTLLHVLVNDTAHELRLAEEYVDSGRWLGRPPPCVPAYSCAGW
jgi:hypothetical protein